MVPRDRFFTLELTHISKLAHILLYRVTSQRASLARRKPENGRSLGLALALALVLACSPTAGAQAIRACTPDSFKLSNFMFPGNFIQDGKFMHKNDFARKGRRPHEAVAPAQQSTTNMNKPRLLAASYYSVKDHLNATLMLSNQGPSPMDVSVTLFSLGGEGYTPLSIKLAGNEVRGVDLNGWVQGAGPKFEEGSLHVSFAGMYLELGGVVRLTDSGNGLIFDEELVEPDRMFASSRLEGVWWFRSEESKMHVAVSNVSGSELTASVSFSGRKNEAAFPVILNLKPHETRVLESKEHGKHHANEAEEGSSVGGVSIRHSGVPGAVIARGYIQEPSVGFSNVVEFYDPATQKSAALDGVGLRFGLIAGQQLMSIAVARNIGTIATTLTGRVVYSTNEGAVSKVELPSVNLSPGETAPIDLNKAVSMHVPTTAASLGLEFQSSAGAGTLVMSALSVSDDGQQVFRVPLINAASLQSSTGTYPWSIDNNSSTFVYLKNATSERQTYTMHISYDGGDYSVGEKTLAPGETLSMDIRQLRDEQTADAFGKSMPKNATHGQLHWSFKGLNTKSIIGRAEQVDVKDGISMTSSCGACCGDQPWDGWLDPDYVGTNYPNSGFQFNAIQENQDCYGNYYTFSPYPVSWDTSNHSIATVDSNGVESTVGAGNVLILADWTTYIPVPNDEDGSCSTEWSSMGANADFEVRPVISSMSLNLVPYWLDGYQAGQGYPTTVTITANVNPSGGSFAWTITQGADKVVFSNNSNTITTSTNSTNISTIGPSHNANDVTISLTYTINSESATSSYSFSVRAPKQLVSTGPNDNFGRAINDCFSQGNFGWLSVVHYELVDQFNSPMGNIGVTEHFNGKNNIPVQNNWPIPIAQGDNTLPGGLFADDICISFAGANPQPTPPQNPLGANLVDQINQSIYAGTTNPGANPPGVHVQDDLQSRYLDHGTHLGVVSPPPNWPN